MTHPVQDSFATTNECDVFGRTCFFNAMKNLTLFDADECKYCINTCDFIHYDKEIRNEVEMSKFGGVVWKEVIGKYLNYKVWHGQYEKLSNKILVEFLNDFNYTVTDKDSVKTYNSFFTKKEEKYGAKRRHMHFDFIIIHLRFKQPEINKIDTKYTLLDKFASFGGKFGIFAQITGCSLIGLINIFFLLFKVFFSPNQK